MGLVSLVIGPLGDLIALCSGKHRQEHNQVIQRDLMGQTGLWPEVKDSNQTSALEGIGKYPSASKVTHAPKWLLTQTQFPRFEIDYASRNCRACSKGLMSTRPAFQHRDTW